MRQALWQLTASLGYRDLPRVSKLSLWKELKGRRRMKRILAQVILIQALALLLGFLNSILGVEYTGSKLMTYLAIECNMVAGLVVYFVTRRLYPEG